MNVLDRYQATGAYHEGHFLLASGRHSPKFLQSTTVNQYPEHCLAFGEAMAEQIKHLKPDFIIGPAMGGITLAFAVAKALGCRAIFAEKNTEGGMFIREAFEIKLGERFVVVEDVVTTGGSLTKALRAAETSGATCVAISCIIDRGLATLPNVPFFSLDKVEFATYEASNCPLCAEGIKLEEI